MHLKKCTFLKIGAFLVFPVVTRLHTAAFSVIRYIMVSCGDILSLFSNSVGFGITYTPDIHVFTTFSKIFRV